MLAMLNLKMMRIRRYRVFLIFAALVTIILVRMARQGEWQRAEVVQQSYKSNGFGGHGNGDGTSTKDGEIYEEEKNPMAEVKQSSVDVESVAHPGHATEEAEEVVESQPPSVISTPAIEAEQPEATPTKTTGESIHQPIIPDREPLPLPKDEDRDTGIHAKPGGRADPITFEEKPTPIHWVPQKEHFPVSSVIQLPTGQPKDIPKIQFAFKDETSDARITREKRLDKVKDEFQWSWKGYREQAWLHDELMPVTGNYKDPFGGWAATLVDSLDTLWIMGFEADFKEAVEAVGTLDFTTANRRDIPVFETTIRYLGGLVAAYDVSGAQYPVLLEKAKQLGEVLMSIFDTPNRMPILYYDWKPAFASNPHRASPRANLAEIGTLSLEFTRLAQITKEAKYYDAVARITDALYEWQQRGTRLDGVFPQTIDASGCNRTATQLKSQSPLANPKPIETARGYEAVMPGTVEEPGKRGKFAAKPENLELQIIPSAPGEPSKGQIKVVEETDNKVLKRDLRDADETTSETTMGATTPVQELSNDGLPSKIESTGEDPFAIENMRQHQSTKTSADWDCVPMGLDDAAGGGGSYSMGGGQDSTYEYFTKQYLLLGGLEPKYQTLYEKTIAAVKKHMLYRPMVPDNREILFSGQVLIHGQSSGEHQLAFDPEVTHLTCFIGGMVGMGAKVFGLDGDVEIAKRLADGCVWAYEVTKSGLMPEYARVVACESAENCSWNQTLWEQYADPIWAGRDQQIADYDEQKRIMAAYTASLESQPEQIPHPAEIDKPADDSVWEASSTTTPAMLTDVDSPAAPSTRDDTDDEESSTSSSPSGPGLRKREVVPIEFEDTSSPKTEIPKAVTHDFREDVLELQKDKQTGQQQAGLLDQVSPIAANTKDEKLQQKLQETNDELSATSLTTGGTSVTGASSTTSGAVEEEGVDPYRPLTHEEFMKNMLEEKGIPPGFTEIIADNYILRPEAIESVWYMYRITGDPIWQEKGWKMFEAVIAATKTTYGHSAVHPVMKTGEDMYQNDSMESFWLAETLKYFYLLFAEPDVISLDEWVLNTEAHPFKRPVKTGQ